MPTECFSRLWLLLLCLMLSGAAVPPAADAQEASWKALGPDGGEVLSLLPDPVHEDVIYAGTSGGNVFASLDGGESWELLAEDLFARQVFALAKGAEADASLFAGTDRGVYRLSAGDDGWKPAGDDLPTDSIHDLVVDPGDSATVYASIAPAPVSSRWRIYRSEDDGESWTLISGGRDFNGPLAISATTPTMLYAGSQKGIFHSTDGGDFWLLSSSGLPSNPFIIDLVVDPQDSQIVYTTLQAYPFSNQPVYKSVDGGEQWLARSQGLAEAGVSNGQLAIDPRNPQTLYVGGFQGFFRSTNGAFSWSAANSAPADVYISSAAVNPHNGDLLAGSFRGQSAITAGVLRSVDQGSSWEFFTEGLQGSFLNSLSPDPTAAGRWLVSTVGQGILRTENSGASWVPSDLGIDEAWLGPVVRVPQEPQTLYVLAGDQRIRYTRIYRSLDGGASWQLRGDEAKCCLTALTVDPRDPSVLYWIDDDTLHKSVDGGATSTRVEAPPSFCNALTIHPTDPQIFFAGCSRDSGIPVSPPIIFSEIYRSEDSGVTWDVVTEPEYDSGYGEWTIRFDPYDSQRLLAGYTSHRQGAFLRSVDGGLTWSAVDLGEDRAALRALLPDDRVPGRWYAGTASHGVLRSVDGGSTWTPWNNGLDAADVTALAFDPFDSEVLWAGTGGGGAFSLIRDPVQLCVSSQTSLCLLERFRVEVSWEDFRGNTGVGQTLPLTGVTGAFWFFQPDNLELAVKVLDGRSINGHYWVFYGALSTVAYELVVTDILTGAESRYRNQPGQLASVGDTRAFRAFGIPQEGSLSAPEGAALNQIHADLTATLGASSGASATLSSAPLETGEALEMGEALETGEPLLLGNDRFRVEVSWHTPQGAQGEGSGVPLTDDSGGLWFFQPENLEVFVKVLDGRGVNGHFWVFYGSLTNVGFDLLVTDTETGSVRQYSNPQGNFGSRADVRAF